ncbi:MAG TPA: hypothetical protein VEV16_13265 [Daejeonella sp.]|nr:hypothetical protein [Daejeonella sp.]
MAESIRAESDIVFFWGDGVLHPKIAPINIKAVLKIITILS